ncbi:unnamed protein product [Boreogadus saida]
MTIEEEEGLTPASAIVGVTPTPVVFTTTMAWEDGGGGGGGRAFAFSSPRQHSPTPRLSPREQEEEEEERMMEVDWIEEDIVEEEEEEEMGRCDSEVGCDHHDDDDDDDEGSSDASVLVVPHPEMVPVVFFCLKQTTFPRSCCISLVSSPYPLRCRGGPGHHCSIVECGVSIVIETQHRKPTLLLLLSRMRSELGPSCSAEIGWFGTLGNHGGC